MCLGIYISFASSQFSDVVFHPIAPHTMGATINTEPITTTTGPSPSNGQQPKPTGAKMHFTGHSFALDYLAVQLQKLLSSHRGFII